MSQLHKPIPQPPPKLLLGNLRDVDPEHGIDSIVGLIRRYGEIIKLQFPTGTKSGKLFVGSQKLVHELSDQERFEKVVQGALDEVRSIAGDGECHSSINYQGVPPHLLVSHRSLYRTPVGTILASLWSTLGCITSPGYSSLSP